MQSLYMIKNKLIKDKKLKLRFINLCQTKKRFINLDPTNSGVKILFFINLFIFLLFNGERNRAIYKLVFR